MLNDEDCTFLSYLNLDLMKNIIQNFIDLTPPVPHGSFFEGLGFFKNIYCEHKEKQEIFEQKIDSIIILINKGSLVFQNDLRACARRSFFY